MKIIHAGILCPYRINGLGLEVLLTRRSFWNQKKNRPMKYPGEWIFPGGKKELKDLIRRNTAIRETREELGYEGRIFNVKFLRHYQEKIHDMEYDAKFFSCVFEEPFEFNIKMDEVIDLMWINPLKGFHYIYSTDFLIEQNREIQKRELNNPIHGKHTIYERQFPKQTAKTLIYMNLLEKYQKNK